MTEKETRQILETIFEHSPGGYYPTLLPATIDRAIQTAKQIGSSWPTNSINVIWLGYQFRIVIE